MQRNNMRKLLFILLAFLLAGASLVAAHLTLAHAGSDQRALLSAQLAPQIRTARLLRAADPQQSLNLSIALRLRNETQADNLLAAIYDPQSPQYHRYLTPGQFAQLFAPAPAQIQQISAYLQSEGLSVTSVAPDNLLIDATGSVAQVQQAFRTPINLYQQGSHVFYANAAPPSIPATLSQLIASISGLDNSAQYQPLYQRRAVPVGAAGLSPDDLAHAYDIAPLHDGGVQGAQQSIALFELDGYQRSDIDQYFARYGIGAPSISNVLVDHFNGAAGQSAVEDELDIETAAAIAPQANMLVYEGPNTTQGLNDTYARIVNDDRVQVVSISWGLCEASSGTAELQTLDTLFKQGALEGMSFVAGSGDAGAFDCQDQRLAVDSPADDPYVTGVGATDLQLAAGGYGSESVWSDASQIQHGPMGGGSGGGLSSYFRQVAWQQGPGVHNVYSNGMREVPDVTAAGAPGYNVYCTVRNAGCPPTGWLTVEGTSAAAPLWAASLVLVNQYLMEQGAGRIGQANPILYKLFNTAQPYPAFHDITSGNNLYYPAAPGYDLASGIGSPDVYNITRDLAA
jgi:subtilase family serine protease